MELLGFFPPFIKMFNVNGEDGCKIH